MAERRLRCALVRTCDIRIAKSKCLDITKECCGFTGTWLFVSGKHLPETGTPDTVEAGSSSGIREPPTLDNTQK